jgi:hypothetical protein
LNAATVLTASDLTLLSPFRRQFFVWYGSKISKKTFNW